MPGAGKTTLAQRIAGTRPAVRFTKDEWLCALGSDPWDRVMNIKVEEQLWRLARETLTAGLSVVIDFGLWAKVERDEMRITARALAVGVELHYLEVGIEELWRRVDERNSRPPWDAAPITRRDLDEWASIFEAPGDAELSLFDAPPTPT